MGTKMDTKDIIRFVNSLRRNTFRYHSGITDCDDAKDIREYNGNLNEVSYKLDRGEKFEKMWNGLGERNGTNYLKRRYYASGVCMPDTCIRELMIKLEAEFLGSSPATIVVEIEKINEIISEVERGTRGYCVNAQGILGKLKDLILKGKEDC